MSRPFKVVSSFEPAGDQPAAIAQLVEGIRAGLASQTLLGVTGSGKTFTMAHVVEQLQRPTIVMAHNKTLAAQLYGEFKEFFPNNAVEYFVSYYDYYQPEAYVPSSDTYIEKDSSVNEHIEQMRLSATKALLEREDCLVVATVSAIYGLGDPDSYFKMVIHLSRGEFIDQRHILRQLAELQYTRNDVDFQRGTYRVRGDVIDIFPADSERDAVRIELFDEEIDSICLFDPLTGAVEAKVPRITIFPKSHYVTSRDVMMGAVENIELELAQRLKQLKDNNKLVEAQRLEQRTRYDMEMIRELGYCTGIENYSRYLSGRAPGEPPPTLFEYLPKNALVIVDESHATIPQIGAMYKGDRSRKETLVEFGFRLPSALDNRPLRFEEWELLVPQAVFVSATPGNYEHEHAGRTVEQVVRPTGLIDPPLEVRPAADPGGRPAEGNTHHGGARGAGAGHHADQAHVGGPDGVPGGSRHPGALPALGYRHGGAGGNHPRPAPRGIRCAGGDQPAAGGAGYAGGLTGGDPGCRQGGLPALGALPDPDHRPGRAQPQWPGDSLRRQGDRFDGAGHGGDRAPPQQAAGL